MPASRLSVTEKSTNSGSHLSLKKGVGPISFIEKLQVRSCRTLKEILNISLNRGSIDNMTIIVITFGNVFRDQEESDEE